MQFDHALAQLILEGGDRDDTLFFAGREVEIASFEAAVRQAQQFGKVEFRIFQGAPGCGKTSLAHHLRDSRAPELAIIQIYEHDLASPNALIAAIHQGIIEGDPLSKQALESAGVIAALLRRGGAVEKIGDAAASRMLKRTHVALHMDEAHVLGKEQAPTLRWLHTGGLKIPAVFLFTGLSHTANHISGTKGLSRLADNAPVHMGRMSDAECRDSTRQMVDALNVTGSTDEREELIALVAEASFGWPQHLHCAQQELTREMQSHEGVLREVDGAAIRAACAARRERYYEDRLAGGAIGGRIPLVRAIAATAVGEDAAHVDDLTDVCYREIRARGLHKRSRRPIDPVDFADALIEKGVFAFERHGRLAIPIPSMATWLGVEGAADFDSGRDDSLRTRGGE